MEKLIQTALELGATHAKVMEPSAIPIDDKLALLCETPRCPNFGSSALCSPHVSGPSGFRRMLKSAHAALACKIDVPSNLLRSDQAMELFRLLHIIVAGVEQAAVKLGYSKSRGFASGGCKNLFCHEYPDCCVLTEQKDCRFPKKARASMSGYGVDVAALMNNAGWEMHWLGTESGEDDNSTSSLVGLILIE